MVEKNLTLPHRFVCFTDNAEGIVEGVEIRPLPELNDEGIPFFEVEGSFLISKDYDFPRDIIGNSSVFRFEVGKHPDIIENFYKEGLTIRERYKNEQAFLSYEMDRKGLLKYWPKDWVVSFKRQCLHKFPLCWFKVPRDPEDAKILIFHGKPTPEQAYKGYFGKLGFRYIKPTKWLDKYWG
jgi:hypothetical protein